MYIVHGQQCTLKVECIVHCKKKLKRVLTEGAMHITPYYVSIDVSNKETN